MNELVSIAEFIKIQIAPAYVVFLRMGAFCALLPGFGEQSLPARVKLGIAVVMTILMTPLLQQEIGVNFSHFFIYSEVFAGIMTGLTLRLSLLSLHTAGAIAAQSTSLSQLLGGSSAEPLPAIGHILVVSGLALVFITGLHTKFLEFFLLSYQLFPVGRLPDSNLVAELGVYRVAQTFALAFTLAAPFVVLSVIYNLALGAINKAMPQLMVAFVGAPLITAGGLIMLLLTAPIILYVWVESIHIFLSNPLSGIE